MAPASGPSGVATPPAEQPSEPRAHIPQIHAEAGLADVIDHTEQISHYLHDIPGDIEVTEALGESFGMITNNLRDKTDSTRREVGALVIRFRQQIFTREHVKEYLDMHVAAEVKRLVDSQMRIRELVERWRTEHALALAEDVAAVASTHLVAGVEAAAAALLQQVHDSMRVAHENSFILRTMLSQDPEGDVLLPRDQPPDVTTPWEDAVRWWTHGGKLAFAVCFVALSVFSWRLWLYRRGGTRARDDGSGSRVQLARPRQSRRKSSMAVTISPPPPSKGHEKHIHSHLAASHQALHRLRWQVLRGCLLSGGSFIALGLACAMGFYDIRPRADLGWALAMQARVRTHQCPRAQGEQSSPCLPRGWAPVPISAGAASLFFCRR